MQPLDVGTHSAMHYASTADFHFTLLGYLNALKCTLEEKEEEEENP